MEISYSTKYQHLFSEVLALPIEERRRFSYDLILSIDEHNDDIEEEAYIANLRNRAMTAYKDAINGKGYPAEEMEARLEAKYPWLCS